MPFDGGLIHGLALELAQIIDFHIEKVHIPSKNEFLFSLKGKGQHHKLFISINPDRPRVNLTTQSFENPDKPPMFCMLLRKHLCGGRITAVRTYGCERMITFTVLTTNELGDKVTLQLVCELMGHLANLILVGADGKILDCAHRSDFEKCTRLLQPGALYQLPENGDKIDLLTGNLSTAVSAITGSELPLHQLLLRHISGISPLVCRELAVRCGNLELPGNAVSKQLLQNKLLELRQEVEHGGTPTLFTNAEGLPKDFSFTEITQYGEKYHGTAAKSYSELLERFYGERDRLRRLERFSANLLKTTKNLLARCEKKLALRKKELAATKNKEQLRIQGELLKANIYQMKRGAASVTVQNYYDETGAKITIPLNPALSPAANAAKYFKDYKKACSAEQTLDSLIQDCAAECNYLQSVLFALQNADDTFTLKEIAEELTASGYLPAVHQTKKQRTAPVKPMEFFCDGFRILVGRNNLQNDRLTLKTAEKTDLWFHTKSIHGAHVILCTEGHDPTNQAILKAAELAAYYSKARESGSVPVDYTPVKFVKKPAGAKPGMVIYTTNKTLYITPQKP